MTQMPESRTPKHAAQPADVSYPYYEAGRTPQPQAHQHVQQRDSSAGLGLWAALVVIATFMVASVAWPGVTTAQDPAPTAEERQGREHVQRPGEQQGDGENGENPEQPAEQPPMGVQVSSPAFALWAPGTKIQATDHYPQPGEQFTAQSCTVAFSFSGPDGRNYAVTAGHCGNEGDLVWPTYAQTAQDYSVEVGHYIYSGLFSEDVGETGDIDVGIIEITDPDRYMDLVGKPIETALYPGDIPAGEEICKTGATTGFTCGQFEASGRSQIIRTDAETERETYGDIAHVCALPGDSGGPVFYLIGGRASIIGVVSGTEAGRAGEPCDAEGADTKMMSYSNYNQVKEVIDRVVPGVDWVEQTW